MSRVAVIGAGPAGLHAARALANAGVGVDVIDSLPTPYGLIRYGVAPDHVRMKACIDVLRRVFVDGVSFVGNVTVGRDLCLDDLLAWYPAVVLATGSPSDRRLGIQGEDLCVGSRLLAGWYSGHPDLVDWAPTLDQPSAVVVGAGNVALDISRVLARKATELHATDVPDHVLRHLAASRLRDVHVLIRRGPADTRFTPAELEELSGLRDVAVVVHDDGAIPGLTESELDRIQARNLKRLKAWAEQSDHDAARRVHLRFFRRPVRIEGRGGRMTAVLTERTAMVDGVLTATGELERIEAGLIVRAIGYNAEPVPGLPFDELTGTVPHDRGRVRQDSDAKPRVYVTGWIKRGPNGRIGTNRADAAETVATLLADLPDLPKPDGDPRQRMARLLDARGIEAVDYPGWLAIDAMERRLGPSRGAERIKVADRARMIKAATDERR